MEYYRALYKYIPKEIDDTEDVDQIPDIPLDKDDILEVKLPISDDIQKPKGWLIGYNKNQKLCGYFPGPYVEHITPQMVQMAPQIGIIALNARISADQRNLKDKDVVVFGTVTLNTGKAYNPTTGKFTAPSRGHYSFTWTIAINAGYMFCTQLVINGKLVSYNLVNGKTGGNNYESGSSTVILRMEKNDVVSILLYTAGEFARGDWSSFSGFKL